MATETKVFIPHGFNIYKGKKTGDGAASSWRMSSKKEDMCVFVEIAKQTGQLDANDNATFGWKKYNKETKEVKLGNSISVKLGLPDIGDILLVLNGVKKTGGFNGKGLFHKNSKGNTTINFNTWEKDGQLQGFSLKVSASDTQLSVSHAISLAEAEVLRVLLQHSILQICNW